MEKVLKPYTIVPEELYVQRDADKQVKNIISDMGRPGYVLVSRQMGKTNLLLSAKRRLETARDAFIYIDLSNTYPTAKACFENIIDNAIEAYPEKFEEVSKIIFERRTILKDTPSHKQHTNELRFLLQSLKGGKIVIILDEIDALTKTDYSDQIFSQIRSTYFASRVNYKEFYNLTYLLSGVVEPTEIIKDPKVSPFNIGQKIYLNDFSKEEFEQFLATAKLNLSQEVRERIFYWTNGNPRISWDVCSEVENRIKIDTCTPLVIDKIVQDLYLTSFDKAPIDNIREIVSVDREIRNSIVEIEYKKGESVSDKVKSKLYLAGIINYEEDDIHIKNEIIRKSLSYEWIRSLEEEDKGFIELAMEDYSKSRYLEALQTFEKFLEHSEFEESPRKPHFLYAMGYSAYALKQYKKAIECFEKTNFDQEDEPKYYFELLYRKGLSLYYLNRIEESLENFKKVIDNGKKDSVYALALLNYGTISLKSDKINHKSDSIRIFNEIISETAFKKDKLSATFISQLKSIAHCNLAEIARLDKDEPLALSNYLQAINLSDNESKPRCLLPYVRLNKDKLENFDLLSKLIDTILSGEVVPSNLDPENSIGFNLNEFKRLLVLTFVNYKDELFQKLVPYLSLLGDQSLYAHLYELAIFAVNTELKWDNCTKILKFIYQTDKLGEEIIEDNTKYYTLKFLAYGSEPKDATEYEINYIDFFEKQRLSPIDHFDMEIFINLIFKLTENKKYDEALKYIQIIDSLRKEANFANTLDYVAIYHLELTIYMHQNNPSKGIPIAEKIVSIASDENIKLLKSTFLGETGLEIVKNNAESLLQPAQQKHSPIVKERSYGRNQMLRVRYKDGTILETKFKKIEQDIKAGECMILV